jgi:hypothetical protein
MNFLFLFILSEHNTMGSLAEMNSLVDELFAQYDFLATGELGAEQLQLIHMDIRIGGISIPQVN